MAWELLVGRKRRGGRGRIGDSQLTIAIHRGKADLPDVGHLCLRIGSALAKQLRWKDDDRVELFVGNGGPEDGKVMVSRVGADRGGGYKLSPPSGKRKLSGMLRVAISVTIPPNGGRSGVAVAYEIDAVSGSLVFRKPEAFAFSHKG